MKQLLNIILSSSLALSSCCFAPTRRVPENLKLQELIVNNGLKIIVLEGTHYEMGCQHGIVLKDEIKKSLEDIKKSLPIPWILASAFVLDPAYDEAKKFIPKEYTEELEGISAGSGVSSCDLERLVALSIVSDSSCSGFAAFNKATIDGSLIQLRNLDWNTDLRVQNHAVVFICKPKGKNSYLNIGYAGFPGVISGINSKGISISEIGGASIDKTFKGTPFVFLMKKIMEEANNLDDATNIIATADRTGGLNYVFGSALENTALAIETTNKYIAMHKPNKKVQDSEYEILIEDIVFRSDFAVNPKIRLLQKCANGNVEKEGFESPNGDSSYDVRYKLQGELLKQNYGKIGVDVAKIIAEKIGSHNNVQSVIYAWPKVYVANAKDPKQSNYRASEQKYVELNAEELLK